MYIVTIFLVALYAIYQAIFAPSPVLPADKIMSLAQKHVGNLLSQNPLVNRVAIVTGSTSGIGREIASELYKLGATVILASRSLNKLEIEYSSIKLEHMNSKGTLIIEQVDMSDLESVSAFGKKIARDFSSGVHYLINNAGIHYASQPLHALVDIKVDVFSKQRYDLAFATNYLGHYLLTQLLLPPLLSSGNASGITSKIIQISSSMHYLSDGRALMPGKALNEMPRAADGVVSSSDLLHRSDAYYHNKLAQILHARELQTRLHNEGITAVKVISTCPG
jgi:retinol dehydrogenase-12